MQMPYLDLNSYLRERFGDRVQKVPIDAGFNCPNRDGTCGSGGCVFCSPRGSAAAFVDQAQSVREQLESGIASARARYRASRFIAYFQAFTNTYLPGVAAADLAPQLRAIYQPALEHPEVVGIAIGTRPDCLPDEVIEMLLEIAQKKLVFLELGLQTSHDATLEQISRGHDLACFADAVERVQKLRATMPKPVQTAGLDIVVHLILGLPGETREMMLTTARLVARLPVQGVKIHMLHVVRGTALEEMYRGNEVTLLTLEEYCGLVCDVLEILPSEMVIHRITGEAARDDLVAPTWVLDKAKVRSTIMAEMGRRGRNAKYEVLDHSRVQE